MFSLCPQRTVLAEMLEAHAGSRLAEFRRHLVARTIESARKVVDQGDVNVFWSDLLAAWRAGAFGPPLKCPCRNCPNNPPSASAVNGARPI